MCYMKNSSRMREIKRRCLICGKKTIITLYPDRHYRNGHYFGKLHLQIKGTGEWKKVEATKLFGKKIDVVKWTGKEKEKEYWECNKCYEEAMHESWLEEILEKLYGKRCQDFAKGCGCCEAWHIYDTIIDYNRGRI